MQPQPTGFPPATEPTTTERPYFPAASLFAIFASVFLVFGLVMSLLDLGWRAQAMLAAGAVCVVGLGVCLALGYSTRRRADEQQIAVGQHRRTEP